MSAKARSMTWLLSCFCGSLLACGADPTLQQNPAVPPDPSQYQTGALSEAFYVGTLMATFQVVDTTFGTTQTMTAILPAWVLVQAPFSIPNERPETNPFHLEIGPGTAIPPRPPATPPLPPGTPMSQAPSTAQPTPGQLFFTSATVQQSVGLLQSSFHVVQSWQYTCDALTSSFSGQLQPTLSIDVNNLFASAMLAGPGSIPPSNTVMPCLGAINQGATVTGIFSANQLEVTVQGTAGGFTQGPTCPTEFQFSAQIFATAKTGQVLGLTCEGTPPYNGYHPSDGMIQP